jgi:hypothetical protein
MYYFKTDVFVLLNAWSEKHHYFCIRSRFTANFHSFSILDADKWCKKHTLEKSIDYDSEKNVFTFTKRDITFKDQTGDFIYNISFLT